MVPIVNEAAHSSLHKRIAEIYNTTITDCLLTNWQKRERSNSLVEAARALPTPSNVIDKDNADSREQFHSRDIVDC